MVNCNVTYRREGCVAGVLLSLLLLILNPGLAPTQKEKSAQRVKPAVFLYLPSRSSPALMLSQDPFLGYKTHTKDSERSFFFLLLKGTSRNDAVTVVFRSLFLELSNFT